MLCLWLSNSKNILGVSNITEAFYVQVRLALTILPENKRKLQKQSLWRKSLYTVLVTDKFIFFTA